MSSINFITVLISCLIIQIEAQTNGRLYLQRRRFSDDLSLEYLRRSVTNLNAHPSRRNSFTDTRPRTMRVTPLQLTTLQEMSPNVVVEDAPRFEVTHSIDVTNQKYQKLKMTKKYLSTVYALCYCIFLIVFSTVIFIGDAVHGLNPIPEVVLSMLTFFSKTSYIIFIILVLLHHPSSHRSGLPHIPLHKSSTTRSSDPKDSKNQRRSSARL